MFDAATGELLRSVGDKPKSVFVRDSNRRAASPAVPTGPATPAAPQLATARSNTGDETSYDDDADVGTTATAIAAAAAGANANADESADAAAAATESGSEYVASGSSGSATTEPGGITTAGVAVVGGVAGLTGLNIGLLSRTPSYSAATLLGAHREGSSSACDSVATASGRSESHESRRSSRSRWAWPYH